MIFEYKVHKFYFESRTEDKSTQFEKKLNQFAKKGWELDQIMYENRDPFYLIFKKLKSK